MYVQQNRISELLKKLDNLYESKSSPKKPPLLEYF